MNGATVLTKFTADTKNFDSKAKKVDASISSIAKGVLVATGVTKAFGAAWSLVTGELDTAIDRFDTLNNFPKVMSNLGISAEESQKSIDKLSDKLTGLPTTLQDGAMAVQRLTSKNGDIKKSTDLFLAMNNAILAGGASSQVQASAIEQLSQAYAKGKPDMMEWRSLMSAMPAQLKQVATAMGYPDADALGEELRNGSVSMDEFMKTIDRLNKEGLPGFQSFEEQARNATGGIRTAITNMHSRVAQGVASVIEAVNKGFQDANMGTLANVFENIGNTIRDTLKKAAPIISKVVVKLVEIAKWISKNKTIIEAIIIPLVSFIATFNMVSKIITIIKGISTAMSVLNVVMMANPIVLIIAAVVALIAVFVYLWNHCEGFRNFWIGLWDTLKNIVIGAWNWIKGIFTSVVNFFKNNWQALLLMLVNPFLGGFKLLYDNCEPFRNFINNFVEKIKTFFNNLKTGIGNAINNIVSFIKSIPGKIVSVPGKIINFFASLPKKMINIGLDIAKGIGNGITNGITWIKNRIKEFVGNVTSFIKKMFKIGSPSKLMANEVGQWIPKGIGVGIEANTKDVTQAMNDIQKQIMTTFQVSPQLANSSSLHYSPNVNVTNNIDIQQDPLGQMVNNIKTYSGGAKNDYNYGAGF